MDKLKQNQESQDLSQLIDLLDSIQKLSLQSANLLDPFQQSVIDSLKKIKEAELAIKKKNDVFDLPSLVYNQKIDARIVNNLFIEFQNQDKNDVFRLIFTSFALNLPFDSIQDDSPFNSQNMNEKLEYVEQILFQKEPIKIQIEDKFITSEQAKQVVMQIIRELAQESKTKNFLSLCYSLIKKIQNKINDLCVVALMRSIIFNAKEDSTPPYLELLDIFSELNSKPCIQDQKEFWWKVCNAFSCYIYLGQENQSPKKLGYPAIPDGQLQLPDMLLIKQNNQLKYIINENFKPVYIKKNKNK
ncbi:hypothetical protein TTHERM_00486640 (macronuclear) [Tetrahymena thermophila SB210]|uniref:Uncharacterized protein n=1 Tax=Tetrahymena thermophila (strain SB210) TaxID=312017 RepID=I7MGJ0_TETTS|nr:hypothetical protein TTHERM_00486640 [Tetrahymena thermophila SB210]EAR85213.1 hypothetical protein TTHERM_00486640 [Tetrahymena thermophila SB210]|eukprot:XP_001032876.1 hypothetical protein TTHERM_00486640 [Tetrahymena thermophila SB210]